MPSTTLFRRGDIVLVPFPFTDLTATKQRPALIISSDVFNASHQDVVLLAITSQIPPMPSAEEFLLPAGDLAACGLPKPSLVRLMKVFRLHHRLVIKRRGALPMTSLESLCEAFRKQF